jgi:hypothetical protein
MGLALSTNLSPSGLPMGFISVQSSVPPSRGSSPAVKMSACFVPPAKYIYLVKPPDDPGSTPGCLDSFFVRMLILFFCAQLPVSSFLQS